MRKACSNHVQTRISLTSIISGVAQASQQHRLNPELRLCPSLLNAATNQIRCVQTCVCVNVGRGPSLPENDVLIMYDNRAWASPKPSRSIRAHTQSRTLLHTHLHLHLNQHLHLHLLLLQHQLHHLHHLPHLHLHLVVADTKYFLGGSRNVK